MDHLPGPSDLKRLETSLVGLCHATPPGDAKEGAAEPSIHSEAVDAPGRAKLRRMTGSAAGLLFRLILDHIASLGFTPRFVTHVHRALNSEFFESCTSHWGCSWEHLSLNSQKAHLEWFLLARWGPKGTCDFSLRADEISQLCRDVMVSYASQRALVPSPSQPSLSSAPWRRRESMT